MKNPLLKLQTKIYKNPEAYCFIKYRGSNIEEVLWNGRDGVAPITIYSRNGQHQLTRVRGEEKRDKNYVPKKGERYFAKMTKERALYLTAKIIEGRWNHPKFPLSKAYESKKEARFLLFKSLFNDGRAYTILKQGKHPIMYLTKQFRNFINSDS